jgi:hypothetical protein
MRQGLPLFARAAFVRDRVDSRFVAQAHDARFRAFCHFICIAKKNHVGALESIAPGSSGARADRYDRRHRYGRGYFRRPRLFELAANGSITDKS